MSTVTRKLAEYFTGPDVSFYSIALSMPDGFLKSNERAKRFFAIRESLGIKGYDDAKDAEASIKKALEQP